MTTAVSGFGLEITEKFLDRLLVEADNRASNAGYNGEYHDGGASHLRELVCAYRAGRDRKLPAFWVEQLKKFNRENDEEYQTYLRLQKKFEK